MAKNDMSEKEPKKEKNIKHGIIAIGSLVIVIVLIMIGIYFYGQYHPPKEKVNPVETNHRA